MLTKTLVVYSMCSLLTYIHCTFMCFFQVASISIIMSSKKLLYHTSVCEKFQTTRAKVAPVIFIYGSHFSATEATYKVSLKMENFVEFTRIRRKPVPV